MAVRVAANDTTPRAANVVPSAPAPRAPSGRGRLERERQRREYNDGVRYETLRREIVLAGQKVDIEVVQGVELAIRNRRSHRPRPPGPQERRRALPARATHDRNDPAGDAVSGDAAAVTTAAPKMASVRKASAPTTAPTAHATRVRWTCKDPTDGILASYPSVRRSIDGRRAGD